MINALISKKDLNIEKSIDWAMKDSAGCLSVFVGRVRPKTNKKKVKYLKYEVYETMAIEEMKKIAQKASSRWNIDRILIHHRTGIVKVGEVPVVIVVSAEHRKDAMSACRYLIDTLKSTVPIWKKEVFNDGEKWVFSHA